MVKTFTVIFEEAKKVILKEEFPSPTGYGQILVRTLKTAVSTGTELTILSGDFPPDSAWSNYARYPFKAGYSNVGEVVEIGEGVEGWSLGDRVIGSGFHSHYVIYDVRQDFVLHVPEDISDEAACTFSLGLIALNGVRRARLEIGESVVVFGLGVIGQLVVQLSKLDGSRPIIGVDLFKIRRKLALKFGADLTVDGEASDIVRQVKNIIKGRMADVVFEVTGNPEIIPREMRLLKKQGRIVILSSPKQKTSFDFHDFCNSPSYTIIGAHVNSHPSFETPYNQWTKERNAEFYFELILRGELHLEELITHRYSWRKAPEVYKMLLKNRGNVGVLIFDWRS